MNVNLNPTGQVPARLLAQMHLVATTAALPVAVATVFADGAAERGLSLPLAEAAAKGVAFMATMAAARKVDDATLVQLTDEYLGKVTGGPDVNPAMLASDVFLSYLKTLEEGTDIILQSGPETFAPNMLRSSQGQSWASPRGLAMKASDAWGAQLARRMGLKAEPGMGREMASFSLSDIAMSLCRSAGLRPFNGVVAKGFQIAQPAIAKAASEVPAVDYRQRNSVGLSASAVPGKLVEGQKIPYTTINEKGELAAKPDDYATITRCLTKRCKTIPRH